MGILLTFTSAALLLVLLGMGVQKLDGKSYMSGAIGGGILGFIVFLVGTVITLLVGTLGSGSDAARLQNTFDNNISLYTAATQQVYEGVPEAGGGLIDSARLFHVVEFSKLTQAQVGVISQYNRELASHRRWEGSFWWGPLWQKAPEYLLPVRFAPVQR